MNPVTQGLKSAKGQVIFFVIVLVIFNDELEAEKTALAIKQLKREMHKSNDYEFKFNKCNRFHRLTFLSIVNKFNFRIRAIIFDKSILCSSHLREAKDDFYGFALRQVLEHNNNTIHNAKIRLDGRGEITFKRQLTLYLRKYLNSGTKKVMENLRFRDSKKDVLIQLADMVAGSIRRNFETDKSDSKVYRKEIKTKEEDIWLFK